jgi:phage baseplate assembly protein W
MGDRMFRPLVGSGVYNQLFEPMTTSTIVSIRNGIENVINRYEPRCVVSRVDVQPTDNENGIEISVVVSLINDPTPITIDVFLERLR